MGSRIPSRLVRPRRLTAATAVAVPARISTSSPVSGARRAHSHHQWLPLMAQTLTGVAITIGSAILGAQLWSLAFAAYWAGPTNDAVVNGATALGFIGLLLYLAAAVSGVLTIRLLLDLTGAIVTAASRQIRSGRESRSS